MAAQTAEGVLGCPSVFCFLAFHTCTGKKWYPINKKKTGGRKTHQDMGVNTGTGKQIGDESGGGQKGESQGHQATLGGA